MSTDPQSSKTRHTEGDWRVFGSEQIAVEAEDGTLVANAAGRTKEEQKANAKFISCGPKLLSALKRAVQHIPPNAVILKLAQNNPIRRAYTRDLCLEAIAEAEGAQSGPEGEL